MDFPDRSVRSPVRGERQRRGRMGALPLAGVLAALPLLASHSSPLAAQAWNSPDAVALVRRAVERPVEVDAHTALRL
jgi:hypothetical protein